MRRQSPSGHTHSRLRAMVLASVCAAASMLQIQTPAEAVGGHCRVTNVRTNKGDFGDGPNLQAAISDAKARDTLRITGRCIGNFTVGKSITLRGVSTARFPVATLDGGDVRRVLTILKGRVFLRDLRITNGRAIRSGRGGKGGGILNLGEVLTLRGSTSVEGNVGFYGAGIYSRRAVTLFDRSSVRYNLSGLTCLCTTAGGGIFIARHGTVDLNDTSTVSHNRSALAGGIFSMGAIVSLDDSSSVRFNTARKGGGIFTSEDVTLNGSSVVSGNTARIDGGGIFSTGTLTLNDSASIVRNEASVDGGGIFSSGLSQVVLYDSSSVIENTAGTAGGGIFISSTGTVFLCSDSVTLSPNSPDDPPATHTC